MLLTLDSEKSSSLPEGGTRAGEPNLWAKRDLKLAMLATVPVQQRAADVLRPLIVTMHVVRQ